MCTIPFSLFPFFIHSFYLSPVFLFFLFFLAILKERQANHASLMRFSKLGSFTMNNFKPLLVHRFWIFIHPCFPRNGMEWNIICLDIVVFLFFFFLRIIHEVILNILLFYFFVNYRLPFARNFCTFFFLCISSKFLINPWLNFIAYTSTVSRFVSIFTSGIYFVNF